MDFDFNIILVPITLFFGFIWLLDKFWFKQHKRGTNTNNKQIQQTQAHLDQKRRAYLDVLSQNGIELEVDGSIDEKTANKTKQSELKLLDNLTVDAAPVAVKQAEREYREAKRQANMAMTATNTKSTHENTLIRWAHDYFPVLLVVLVVRSFIIEPFNIPSPSMVPTLYTGDFIAVNKFAYGLRLPLAYTKVVDTGSPEHGDVVVFRSPENPDINFIKRVIGLPGDTVSYNNGQLSINGEPIPTKQVDFTADEVLTDRQYSPVKSVQSDKDKNNASNSVDSKWSLSPEAAVKRGRDEESVASYYQEQLGEHTYLRRYLEEGPYVPIPKFLDQPIPHNGSWEVQVPEGNYFVMGDNSDRSEDSRFWGFVPDQNLSGKAFYVWMHKKPGLTNLPTFKYNRSID